MVRRSILAFAFVLLVCGGAAADVSLRRAMTMKFASFIPPEFQEPLRQFLHGMPIETFLRIKGDKAYASYGQVTVIADYGRNEVTLLDPKGKRYASVALAELGDRFATAFKAMLPSDGDGQLLPQHLVFDAATKQTGQAAVIQGIRAEESLTEMAMKMPPLPADPAEFIISTMRLEVHSWVAQAAEIRRVSALKELAEYTERSIRVLDLSEFVIKALSSSPGFDGQLGEMLGKFPKTETDGALTLKVSTAVYMPAISQALQLGAGGPMPGYDPNGPIAELLTDVVEISTGAVPDAVFAMPLGYQEAPFEELVKAAIQTPVALPPVKAAR